MEALEKILSMLERSLSTKRKRHITGGALLSISLLFGGLAITIITISEEKESEEKRKENEKRNI